MNPPTAAVRKLAKPPVALWRQLVAPLAGVVVVALAVFALHRISREVTLDQIVEVVRTTSVATLVIAGLLTALSYFILTGYDWLALDHLGYRLPFATIANAAFSSFTMSHTLGMTALTGGTVRYRIYTRVGVKPLDIILIVALCGWTFWLGVVMAAGIGLTIDPGIAAAVDVLPAGVNRFAGFLLLAGALGYSLFASFYRREIRLFGLHLTLPNWRSTCAQLVIGGLDLAAAAAALYMLLPSAGMPPFVGFVVIYAVAMIVGALSHAPGGLGVFEIVVVGMLPHIPKNEVLAALLLFRVMYTLVPFILGVVLLTATELEALKRRRAISRAPGAP
ncbi:MAG: lysylphosphatidylglycerol synthase domain-containing protein [Janthinobacterium lividum]